MNFSEVTSIVIPEGKVTQIKVGNVVLYKEAEQLVCEPVLVHRCEKYYDSDAKKDKIRSVLHLSGISKSLITKFAILVIQTSKLSSGQLVTPNTVGRTSKTHVFLTGQDPVIGCDIGDLTTPTSSTTSYTFRWYITYTDLDGKTQTKYSEQIATTLNSLS